MPREFVPGGVLDVTSGTQKLSWGTILTTTTPITCSFLLNLRAAGSSSFDVLWGFSQQRWFFILNGSNTRRLAFNIVATTEKTSGYIGSNLTLGTWYTVVGGYDPAGGANNHFIKIYNMDGTSFATSTVTSTGALTTATNALVAGADTVRSPSVPVNAQMKNFRVWDRVLTSGEHDALALNQEVDRSNLVLEALCNEASGSLRDTSTVSNTRPGTLSGGAVILPTPPSQFARARVSNA